MVTHLDIVYPGLPVKVCVRYAGGVRANSRLDQRSLDQLRPVYKNFSPWDKEAVQKARRVEDLPFQARQFLSFLSEEIGLPILMVTTGPRRGQGVSFNL